jgi:hypothetical protein
MNTPLIQLHTPTRSAGLRTCGTTQEFIDWYNNRPHGILSFDSLETPEKAFWREIPLEAVFGIGHGLFGL